MLAGEEPVEQRRPNAADVKVAGRAGCESRANRHPWSSCAPRVMARELAQVEFNRITHSSYNRLGGGPVWLCLGAPGSAATRGSGRRSNGIHQSALADLVAKSPNRDPSPNSEPRHWPAFAAKYGQENVCRNSTLLTWHFFSPLVHNTLSKAKRGLIRLTTQRVSNRGSRLPRQRSSL